MAASVKTVNSKLSANTISSKSSINTDMMGNKEEDKYKAWDRQFKQWKDAGFPMKDPNIPVPPPHPDWPNDKHLW